MYGRRCLGGRVRTIVLRAPRSCLAPNPYSPGCRAWSRTIARRRPWFARRCGPDDPDAWQRRAPNPNNYTGPRQPRVPITRTIQPRCLATRKKRPRGSHPEARFPNKYPPAGEILPASPRGRCYSALFTFLRYHQLSLQPLLALALRSSSYALPYAEILQVSQALALYSSR